MTGVSHAFVEALRAAAPTAVVERDVPLARFTTMRVGGPADVLASVSSARDAEALVGVARAHGVPVTVLGGGSNVLVADAGVRGLTLRIHGGEIVAGGCRTACAPMRASPSTGSCDGWSAAVSPGSRRGPARRAPWAVPSAATRTSRGA